MKNKNLRTKISATLIMLIMSGFTLNAQYLFPDKAKCETLKGRTLAVKLFDEANPEFKPYNEAIRKAYTEEWKITLVEFVSQQQYDEIVKAGNTKYAVVYASDVVNILTQEFKDRNTGLVKFERTFNFAHYDVYLSLVSGAGKLDNITSVSFINGDLLPSEFFFAAEQLVLLTNASLNGITGKAYYDAEKNIEYIKSKKFLLPEELFKAKDLAKISEKYEHPYKVSNFNELNELVLAKNAEYVYPKIIWSNQHRAYGWITISAQDGSVRSFMAFSGLATGTNEKANEVLKPGQLNNALSKMMQKVNNKYD